jgi:hypothetical protein
MSAPRWRSMPAAAVDPTVDVATRRAALFGWWRRGARAAAQPRTYILEVWDAERGVWRVSNRRRIDPNALARFLRPNEATDLQRLGADLAVAESRERWTAAVPAREAS